MCICWGIFRCLGFFCLQHLVIQYAKLAKLNYDTVHHKLNYDMYTCTSFCCQKASLPEKK